MPRATHDCNPLDNFAQNIWLQGMRGCHVPLQNGHGLTSATWPVANLAVFAPIRIYKPISITQLLFANGSTISGNLDVGVYTLDGTRIVSTGSQAQSGSGSVMLFSITATLLGIGTYYIASAMDNTTGTSTRSTATLGALMWKAAGLAEMTSAFPLPATATLATAANNYLPFASVGEGYAV